MENVHFQSNSDVCASCGESGLCDCDILDHVADMNNNTEIKTSPQLFENDDNNSQDGEDEGIMEMVVVNPCSSKKEVFNTYGQHSNSYLLNRYGFCEENNPNDVVNFDQQDIIQVLEQLSIENLDKRLDLWDRSGRNLCHRLQNRIDIRRELDLSQEEMEQYNEEDDDEIMDDLFYLDYNHKASFHLYCFLHLMLMKSSVLNTLIRDTSKYEMLIEKMAYKMWNADKSLDTGLPLSQEMMQLIYLLSDNRLAKYPTTLAQDLELMESFKKSNKLKNALILRLSEKRILTGFLKSHKGSI